MAPAMTCAKCGEPMIETVRGVLMECRLNSHAVRLLPVPEVRTIGAPTGRRAMRVRCIIGSCHRAALPDSQRCRSHTSKRKTLFGNRGPIGKRLGGQRSRRNPPDHVWKRA